MARIAIILGSVTPPGRFRRALKAAGERAGTSAVHVDLVDLADYRLDFADGRPATDHADDSARLIELVSTADAVILASPVYRGTYTGALKNLLDWLPVESLEGKPVGIVAMGATQHHYLGVDWQLRAVLAWFGALVAPTSVYLASEDFSEGEANETAAQALDALIEAVSALAAARRPASGLVPLAAGRNYRKK